MTSVHTDPADPTESVPVYEMVGAPASAPDRVWEEELPIRPVRQKLGRLTLGLLVLAFAAGAFYAGVVIEKHSLGSTSTAATTRAATARAATSAAAGGVGVTGAAGGVGGAGGAGGAGGTTVGQVKLIDGPNIYVTDATGNIVKVATTPASQITVTSSGTVKDVKPGDTVLVTGPTGSDGTVSATAVRDSGAGGGGFGGRANRGGGGAAGGGTAGGGAAAG